MKLYKRDGRRFVEIQDVTGMFFQKDGSFTRTRNEDTIGICVLQTASIRKVVLLEPLYGMWHCCDAVCRLKGAHIPSRAEMFLAINLFIKDELFPPGEYWVKAEYDLDGAWVMYLYEGCGFGNVFYDIKYNDNLTLAFKDIQI